MISLETARQFLNFEGRVSARAAEEQLKGAVAIHNLLSKHGAAYLADEVGMGKTYVALGALALFRHFQPRFRVLIIAPRENIQKKWRKELQNFVTNCVRFPDLRVKALHDAPARSVVLCGSLLELVHQTALDADRDFIARMPSFSLAVTPGEDGAGFVEQSQAWRQHLPWLDEEPFTDRRKREFKDAIAKAACCALPAFDLVIVDEAHHLKAGLRDSGAFRNRVLALTMGHPAIAGDVRRFKGYGPRANRVLFLSATPVEDDYAQLWNQLNVFNRGDIAPELNDTDLSPDERKAGAQRFLIRRITQMKVGDQTLTKNLYRREWRNGGVQTHDEALPEPKDPRARLAVALVQKKVSELIGGKFGNQFQIGMLASFESFLQTARIGGSDPEESNFDDAEQTEDESEREGVDVQSVNTLARSYRTKFGAELPHPKMDGLVDSLSGAFDSGEKALVFVRRVASVKELQRKLEDRYDGWLITRLQKELRSELWPRIEREYHRYREQRAAQRDRLHGMDSEKEEAAVGLDSFFAYFFRGDGPEGILSGADVAKRFSTAGALQSTFFEDNHVARLMQVEPAQALERLIAYLGGSAEHVVVELKAAAARQLTKRQKHARRDLFLAYQYAAINAIARSEGPLRRAAEIVRQERYSDPPASDGEGVDAGSPEQWLAVGTFWTDLRARPRLQALMPGRELSDDRDAFHLEEVRRELLSAMCRLGSPIIDLYVLLVNRLESVDLRAREDRDASTELSHAFLDLLERQSDLPGHHSFRELSLASKHLSLILDTNAPELRQAALNEAREKFGTFLRQQMPVGGMFAKVNDTLVRQFRMPGYPLVLLTTDLLQEGEDLHTFCSRILHYGISWMPSSMEQRIGRIDRVSSETERRLSALTRPAEGSEKLQVFYPHLRQTVELLQVRRVLERMDTFVEMMHQDIASGTTEKRYVDVAAEVLQPISLASRIPATPLKTAFDVRPAMLGSALKKLAATGEQAAQLQRRFEGLASAPLDRLEVTWEQQHPKGALLGTASILSRKQPFTLLSRSIDGRMLLRCISPVGRTSIDQSVDAIASTAAGHSVRLAAVKDDRFDQYDLTVEADVVMEPEDSDVLLASELIRRVTAAADELERTLLARDGAMDEFRDNLGEESNVAR